MPEDDTVAPPDPATELLRRNLSNVRQTAEAAARRAGRPPGHVRLIAVTKTVGAGIIRRLIRLGVMEFGENRIQDALAKMDEIAAGPTWHLVGSIQANKSRRAVERFPWIHSIDSGRLLARMDQQAGELGRRPRVLLQVNVSGEASKHGFTPDEVRSCLEAVRCKALVPCGLMTMAPLADDPEAARPWFRRLRELRDELRASGVVGESFTELSMGMTDDYPVAIEEGATLIRVGRALFAGLEPEDG